MQDRECDEIIEVAEGPSVCAHPQEHEAPHAVTIQEESAYSIKVWIERPHAELLEAARNALAEAGCTILNEIDVRDFARIDSLPHYTILEVARPEWVLDALELDRGMGVLLPLSLAVYEQADGAVLEAVDPMAKFALAGGGDLQRLGRAIKQTLIDVIDRVAGRIA